MPFPPSNKLTVAEVFDPRTNKPKPEVLKQHFILEGRLDEATALKIIKGGAAILKDEDTMIELEAPVTGEKMFIIIIFPRINLYYRSTNYSIVQDIY